MKYPLIMMIPACFIMFFSCLSMPAQVVDEETFLAKRVGQEITYRTDGSEYVQLPLFFSVERKDLDFIILVDLKKPCIYKTVEYQAVKDERGTGHIVILYDLEDRKNIYFSPGLAIGSDDYSDFPDVRQIRETPIQGFFEYREKGLIAEMSMVDSEGRHLSFVLEENHTAEELGGLVAPVADDVEEPDCFPFIYMDYFGFSPVEGTKAEVTINGVLQEIVSLPVKLNGIKPYMIRYSLGSPVLNWNREIQDAWDVISLMGNEEEIPFQGWDYRLSWNDGIPDIRSLSSKGDAGEITIRFSPPLPNCLYLDHSAEIQGRFSFSSERHRGIFAGEYTLSHEKEWRFTMQPTHSSKPAVLPGKWWRDFTFELHLSQEDEKITSNWRKK